MSQERPSVLQNEKQRSCVGLWWTQRSDADGITRFHLEHAVVGTARAIPGNPGRPLAFACSQRFRFCPVAFSSAWMFTLTRSRSLNRLSQCHYWSLCRSALRLVHLAAWRQAASSSGAPAASAGVTDQSATRQPHEYRPCRDGTRRGIDPVGHVTSGDWAAIPYRRTVYL